MRVGIIVALLLAATAGRAEERLGLELEIAVGIGAPLTGHCFDFGCPGAPVVSLRVGYAPGRFGSVGVRGEAALGPKGDPICFGSCTDSGGYRSAAVALDGMVHTLGDTQFIAGAAVGIGRLIRLQCACQEYYDTHGSRLPVLQFALGVRTYSLLPRLHVGLEARYSVMFGTESGGFAPVVGRPGPISVPKAESLTLSVVLGASI